MVEEQHQGDLQGGDEDLIDDILGGGDVIDDFHSLKGMMSGALGRLGFKFSFVVVLLFNFFYTVYNAFTKKTKTEISFISLNNCSCDFWDEMFYRFTTFGFIALWVLFLLIYALCCIKKYMCKSRCNHNLSTDGQVTPAEDNRNKGLSTDEQVVSDESNCNEGLSTDGQVIPDESNRNEGLSADGQVILDENNRNEGLSTDGQVVPDESNRNEGLSTDGQVVPDEGNRNEGLSTDGQVIPDENNHNEGLNTDGQVVPDESNRNEGLSRDEQVIPDNHNEDSNTDGRVVPDEYFWFLKRELKKLTTMVFILSKRSLHNKKISLRKEVKLTVKHMLTHMKKIFLVQTEDKFNFPFDNVCKCFMCLLIVVQFVLRLPIVPLLLVQWLDEYSWHCVIGLMKEDYCREMPLDYAFHQSIAICCLYICVLLSIIITICIRSMPVRYHRKDTSQSNWCLVCRLNRTPFLTNVSFVMIIALIYTSIMSQLTYVAITETERDINSERTFSFGKWHNRSISGGISNSVLWKCSEESNLLQLAFVIFPIILIATTVFYGVIKLLMALVNYQKVKKLINFYYQHAKIHNSESDNVSVAEITIVLHKLFQKQDLKITENESAECWKSASESNRNKSHRWCNMLFLIPAIELICILLLCILVLISYNVYPIGCFFHNVNYDEETSTVMLEFKEGVYTYQQVAVVMAIFVFFGLFAIKACHFCCIQAPDHLHHNQVSYHYANLSKSVRCISQKFLMHHYVFLCKYVHIANYAYIFSLSACAYVLV